jgi:hypothetical protein
MMDTLAADADTAARRPAPHSGGSGLRAWFAACVRRMTGRRAPR